jgi:hypothetical protein
MSKGTIKIKSQSIAMCPSLFEVILPDGSEGRLKYRWGIIAIIQNTGHGLFDPVREDDKLPKEADGHIELEEAVSWLESKGYQVDTSEFVDLTDWA